MILLLVALLGTAEGRNCSISNGGCAHYCIDRNDGNDAFCGCPCYYQVDPNGQTCSLTNKCNVDMMWMFDFSNKVMDFVSCAGISWDFGVPDTTPFVTWRDTTASYLQAFNTEIDSSEYHVGTILSGGLTLVVTNNFTGAKTASDLQAEVMAVQPVQGEVCGDQLNVFRETYKVANGDPTIPIQGYGDSTSTTRVAVVTMVTPMPSTAESSLSLYTDRIHTYFDQVFVIGKKDVSLFLEPTVIDEHLRLLACRNRTATNCPYLFYTDSANDNGASFTRPHVNPMIDREACVANKPTLNYSVACGITDITITIPLCILGGLDESDLQLNDPSCNISNMSQRIGQDIVVTVSYDACSWVITYETVGGYEFAVYTQTVTRKSNGISDSAKIIRFDGACRFLRYSDEDLGQVAPVQQAVTGSVTINATFDIELLLYENDSYTAPYAVLPSEISVMDRLYFAVEATMPSSLDLILFDFKADASADQTSGTSYDIVSNQCINDDTFQFETSVSDHEKRFSVQMFEFTSTANAQNGQKDPVYFFVTTYVCLNTDTSDSCTQACPSSRRKRAATNDENPSIKMHRIGPFFIGQRKSRNIAEGLNSGRAYKDSETIAVTTEFKDPSYMKSSCLWMFIMLIATLVVINATKCLMKGGHAKVAELRKRDVASKDIKQATDPKKLEEPKM